MSYPLPADIRALDIRQGDIENFGLLSLRFVDEQVRAGGQAERQEYETLIELFHRPNGALQRHLKQVLQALQGRDGVLRQSLTTRGYHCSEPIVCEVAWRLTSGLGTPSVFNTGFALHRLFGFPYLSASSVKGIVRHYALATHIAGPLGIYPVDVTMLSDMAEIRRWKKERPTTALTALDVLLNTLHTSPREMKEEERKVACRALEDLKMELRQPHRSDLYTWPRGQALALDCSLQEIWDGKNGTLFGGCAQFCRAFGSTHRRGGALFFDLLPMADPPLKLRLDIMNPHYRKYYTNVPPGAPNDHDEPNPVYFLTVDRGAQFRAFVAGTDKSLLDRILCPVGGAWTGWLPDALQQWGVGAKTRAGYGELLPKPAPAPRPVSSAPASPQPLVAEVEPPIVQRVRQLPRNRVSQEIRQYYDQIKSLSNPDHQKLLARAIREKIREANWKGARSKDWVKELDQIIGESPA